MCLLTCVSAFCLEFYMQPWWERLMRARRHAENSTARVNPAAPLSGLCMVPITVGRAPTGLGAAERWITTEAPAQICKGTGPQLKGAVLSKNNQAVHQNYAPAEELEPGLGREWSPRVNGPPWPHTSRHLVNISSGQKMRTISHVLFLLREAIASDASARRSASASAICTCLWS